MADVTKIPDLQAVVYAGPQAQPLRQALSARRGAIVPLLMDENIRTVAGVRAIHLYQHNCRRRKPRPLGQLTGPAGHLNHE